MNKKNYDNTSTLRSKRLSQNIKNAGGATFSARFKTAANLEHLDALVASGYGASRNEVLIKLVEAEYLKLPIK